MRRWNVVCEGGVEYVRVKSEGEVCVWGGGGEVNYGDGLCGVEYSMCMGLEVGSVKICTFCFGCWS